MTEKDGGGDVIDDYLPTESTTVEYKVSLETAKPKSWLKTISAFANTCGGTIVWGVADDRTLVGLDDIDSTARQITELIKARIEPLPAYEMREIENRFLVLTVREGSMTPYYYTGDGRHTAYIRTGEQSVEAPPHILNSLILRGQNNTFDTLPSAFKLDNVSFTLLEATYRQRSGGSFDKTKDLFSFGLVTKDGQVTYGGLLFCDQAPLRQSRIFCTRWNGRIKGTLNADALDDKEYGGSIIALLENAETFVRNNSKNSWFISGLRRSESSDYSYEAVREALVNAIIHRDYQIVGSEIHVDMFDDRLEIYSPGGMCSGNRIQDLNLAYIPSLRRNPVISDLFGRLGYMERRGSGIGRILEQYADNYLSPSFYSDSSSFIVIFPKRGAEGRVSSPTGQNEYNDRQMTDKKESMTDKKHILLKHMRETGRWVTNSDVKKMLGVSEATAKRYLTGLVKEGMLIAEGENKARKYRAEKI